MANVFPRETVEFQGVPITIDGIVTVANIEYCVVAPGSRPLTWIPAVTLAGNTGLMVQGRSVGTYQVWARVTSSPEIPVINCGTFSVS